MSNSKAKKTTSLLIGTCVREAAAGTKSAARRCKESARRPVNRAAACLRAGVDAAALFAIAALASQVVFAFLINLLTVSFRVTANSFLRILAIAASFLVALFTDTRDER